MKCPRCYRIIYSTFHYCPACGYKFPITRRAPNRGKKERIIKIGPYSLKDYRGKLKIKF
jgi:ribosomal protein L37E